MGLEGIDLAAHFALTKKVMTGNPRNQTKTTVVFGAFSLAKLNRKGHPIAFIITDWLMLEERLCKVTSRVNRYRSLPGMLGVINHSTITIPPINRPSERFIIILGGAPPTSVLGGDGCGDGLTLRHTMTNVLSAMKVVWQMQGKVPGFPNELVFRNHIAQDSAVSIK